MKKILSYFSLLVVSVFSTTVSAGTPVFPHLETFGESELQVKPDAAILTVAVSLHKKTAKSAKQATDEAVSALLFRLTKMNITDKEFNSANLTIYPQYHYENNNEKTLTGYKATRSLDITINDLNKLNTVLDSALIEGVNRIEQIRFITSEEKKYKAQARMAAIENAKDKAEQLAKGFDRQLAGVWQIRDVMDSPRPPVMLRSVMASDTINDSYTNAPILINARVDVIFALSQ